MAPLKGQNIGVHPSTLSILKSIIIFITHLYNLYLSRIFCYIMHFYLVFYFYCRVRNVFTIDCYCYVISSTSPLSNRIVVLCSCCYCYQVVCLSLQLLLSLFVTSLPLSCSENSLFCYHCLQFTILTPGYIIAIIYHM